MATITPKITPFLWFDGKAHEAADFYVSIFSNSHIVRKTPQSATFVLDGQRFNAFDGGPHYKFNPAISLFITCENQAEVDRFWEALTADGGSPVRCGWVTDKFGVSWQVVPKILSSLLEDDDKEKARRAMQAMLGMEKLDIGKLEAAHAGAP